jgi:hypothetical protein
MVIPGKREKKMILFERLNFLEERRVSSVAVNNDNKSIDYSFQ